MHDVKDMEKQAKVKGARREPFPGMGSVERDAAAKRAKGKAWSKRLKRWLP